MAISVLGSNREKTCEPELPFVKNVYIRQYLYILGLIFTGIFFKYAIEIKLEIKCKTTLFFFNRQLYNVRFLRVENSKAYNATAVGF